MAVSTSFHGLPSLPSLPSPHRLAFLAVGTPLEPSSPFLSSSSWGQMQGLTVSPEDRIRKPEPGSDFLCTVPVAALVLILGTPLATPPSVLRSPSHPPRHCRWGHPVTCSRCVPGFLSSFQVEGIGDSGVRRSRLPLLLCVPLIPL